MTDFEQIKQQTDIVQFITSQTGMQVKKVGTTLRLESCPKCNHKNCFTINQAEQYFKCFSGQCNWGGDMFSFISGFYNITDKKELLIKAADLTNYPLTLTEQKKTDTSRQLIFIKSAAFYEQLLLQDKTGMDILFKTRRYNKLTVEQFHIGYTGALKSDRQKLYKYLKDAGIKDDQMLKSGLIKVRKKIEDYFVPGLFVFPHLLGDVPHDFTIKDAHKSGKKRADVIDYRLEADHRLSKEVYFYNQSALNFKDIIITEGQHDAIQMMRASSKINKDGSVKWNKNVLAITGNPSKEALEFLQKSLAGKSVWLAFDQDDAGRKYNEQFFLELWPFADKIKTLEWEPASGKDIDEYLRGQLAA